jgi:predicted short-subunit dehydrogenase-like oxidoreductase (DUF2520 family)
MKPSNSSPPAKTLNIVGAGKVAQTLGRLWTVHGSLAVQDVLNRSRESAQRAVAFIGAGRTVDHCREMRPADIWLIGTNDDQIVPCAEALIREAQLAPGTVVFHCSGAKPSAELKPIIGADRFAASIHPIRSFASPEQVVQSFQGTWCGAEGDAQALAILNDAFAAIGAQIVPINTEHKALYHSAAVFACNYLVTLMDVAQQTYVKAGVPEDVALKLMEPLVKETVENVFRLGTKKALTGPIARGDVATTVKQYRAVNAWNRRFGELYKKLGKLTKVLADKR